MEIIADNLPGFPDNINRSSRDSYWLAIPSLRMASFDALAPYPFRRCVVARLSSFLSPQEPPRYGLVLELTGEGEILGSLHDPSGEVALVTSATEQDGQLYLGSAYDRSIRTVPVPEL